MKLVWATDVHLNFLEGPEAVRAWCRRELLRPDPAAVLLSGDTSEAPRLLDDLGLLEEELARPLYFVLGNHDFYRGGIEETRARVRARCAASPHLRWLGAEGVVELTARTALVGVDGWGDARLGDYAGSGVRLNDFLLIDELRGLGREALRARLEALGAAEADALRPRLLEALERFPHVLVLTHVPPFREASWHEGRASDDAWAPFFSCGAVGDVLRQAARVHPERAVTVLCGHTHGGGEAWIEDNLLVRTGAAVYGAPAAQPPILVR